MGLLTNPHTREKISNVISKYNNKLCFLCYVAGLGYFLALAYRQLNAGVYFSENALLPGLVEADFYADFGANGHLNSLKEEVKSRKDHKDHRLRASIPTDWITTRMREIGLDVYVQNYSFVYPEKLLKAQVFSGQNIYGILRAPRAASSEALVLSAPFRPAESPLEKTHAGIALMLGIAKAFRRHTYWAKDIIFLVTEHEQVGMQAWLDAYHNTDNKHIYATELPGRSGSIQAAINLELSADTTSRVNIKMEGLNGQLPNLDLINLIVRLCRREGIPAALQRRTDYNRPETPEGFKHALGTMLRMMWNQASGVPTGNHGLYHRYHIEAITLQGIKMKNSRKSIGLVEMGRMVEGVFRSLNNLLERFHQSFFFYLLPATDRYVSIGLYMPPFGILALPILIKAIALWLSYGIHTANEKEKEEESLNSDDKKPEGKNKEESDKKKRDLSHIAESFNTFLTLVPTCAMCVFFGLGAYYSPRYFIETASALHTKPQEGLVFGFIAIIIAAVMYPSILSRKVSQKGQTGPDWQLLKCMGLLSLAVILGVISVINISLAFFLTAIWSPVMLLARPTNNRLLRLLQYPLLLAVSPLGLLYLACLASLLLLDPATSVTPNLFGQAFTSTQEALLVAVIETHLYNNWTFSIVTLTLLPTWCLFWSLLWTQPYC